MSAVAVAQATTTIVKRLSQLAEFDLAALAAHPDAAAGLRDIASRARVEKDALLAVEEPYPGPRPPITWVPTYLPLVLTIILTFVNRAKDRRLRDEHEQAHARRMAWWLRVQALDADMEREVLAWRERVAPGVLRACTNDRHAALDVLEERDLLADSTAQDRPALGWFVLRAALAHP